MKLNKDTIDHNNRKHQNIRKNRIDNIIIIKPVQHTKISL